MQTVRILIMLISTFCAENVLGQFNPIDFSGAVVELGAVNTLPAEFRPPPGVAPGELFRGSIIIDSDSPPEGTDQPVPPGFGGTVTRYPVRGTIEVRIGKGVFQSSLAEIVIVNDVTTPVNPVPLDFWRLRTVLQTDTVCIVTPIELRDATGNALSDTSFFIPNGASLDTFFGEFEVATASSGDCDLADSLVYRGVVDDIRVSVGALVEALISLVIELNLKNGIDNSLDGSLQAALKATDDLRDENDSAAAASLDAFVRSVKAKRGNQISGADAQAMIDAANTIIEHLDN